ncbi:hypothetical protein F4803DRAFT_52564 [Xylaria telfairii]|nr:hypothetical protein F4803DRAFT_52564 [Xylaria telfairii]
MDSSFAELIHADPGHGSPLPASAAAVAAAAAAAGVGDNRGVNTVALAADSGRASANGADPSATATGGVTTAVPALTRSGSGVMSSAAALALGLPAPAPPAATATATAPSQAQSAQTQVLVSLSSSASSSPPPDRNSLSSPSAPASPPSKHSILHAHRQNHNSSKLPAFRFTDLNKESIALSSLLQQPYQLAQQHHIPPSPVSPDSDQHQVQPDTASQLPPPPLPKTETTQNHETTHDVVSPIAPSEPLDSARSRASTFQPPSAPLPTTASSAHVKRSVSLDTTSAVPNTSGVRSPSGSTETIVTVLQRHAPDTPNTPLGQGTDTASGGLPAEATATEAFSGQRELLLPKALQRTASDDKRASISRKPPVSYKPRSNNSVSGVTASIPPIRAFRSSGERRSLVLDMNVRSARAYDGGDDYGDANHRDRTLRALEGRRGDESMQWTPPDSATERPDGDDTGDLFLKIAREDSSQRTRDGGRIYADNPNVISRVARSARRPLSVAISSYRSPSPPRISRRMSEQESRARVPGHDQGERTGPPVSYRGHSREPHSEDLKLRGVSTPLRASPLTPRTLTYQDPPEAGSSHRRRQPSIDRSSAIASRMTSLKQSNVNYSHPRAFNSSPLVTHAPDPQRTDAPVNEPATVEGTDSTTSTAAPSTVWDELEELKSRIHRLELTGKLPPSSSAAISRVSDERPPTAHTNATTLSSSPKRGASSAVQTAEAPTPKDNHPLLHSALAKSKDLLVPEVYDALETATIDALALAAMMGTAGQPGPISSGASNVSNNCGTVTDRQLRKKADSVCRSLTELCLALSENVGAAKTQPVATSPSDDAIVGSPTITQFTGMATQRRPSVPPNRAVELAASPRVVSRYEEKRATVLTSSALPGIRYNANMTATEGNTTGNTAGRKSSLLFSRARRAGTEEPEDGRRTSAIMRNRRAGTEEPEEPSPSDRKPILTRGRRATIDPGSEDESRFRTPSRAVTEVNGLRPREYISQLPPPPPLPKEADTLANSALPRRRLGTATVNTRLAQPTTVTTASAIATPSRRYFDRPMPSRETAPEPEGNREDRPQRQFSLARSGSMNRRVTNRQSMIATPSTGTTSYYR